MTSNIQSSIVSALKEGKLEGHIGIVPEHIETVISHVFLFGDTGYKLYKDNSSFFNEQFSNLADVPTRLAFVRSDFKWNHTVTPEIYLDLKGIQVVEGVATLVEPDSNVEHLVIVMKRFNKEDSFLNILIHKILTSEEYINIGSQLSERLHALPPLEPKINLYINFRTRIADLHNWVNGLAGGFSVENVLEGVEFLSSFLETNHETLCDPEDSASCVDIHSENAVYSNGILFPIDTYPPKEDWKVGSRDMDLYRLAVDVLVFNGEDAFRSVLKGYEQQSGRTLRKEHEPFWTVYVACIMVPYLYYLGNKSEMHKEAALKYQQFLDTYLEKNPRLS